MDIEAQGAALRAMVNADILQPRAPAAATLFYGSMPTCWTSCAG